MSDITYTRITPNGEERCEMLTTEDKLEKIKHLCMSVPDCGLCLLKIGRTCRMKYWEDWTDEEINTAFDIIVAKTAKDSLPNGDGMTIEAKAKAIEEHCNDTYCDDCPLEMIVGINNGSEECYDLYHEGFHCDIDRNYKILVDAGCIKPPVNFVKANPDDEIEPENDAVESDAVNHPNHYTQNGIECISAIRASMTTDGFCDYCKGNIIKYLWRWRDKGGVEDLRKARVYLDWLIEEAEK